MAAVPGRFSGGLLKPGTKNGAPERSVYLRQRLLDALDRMPTRIDTTILFPAPNGGYIDIGTFRHREWSPALRAAGLAVRGPNHMRHTFATSALESDDPKLSNPSYIAKLMGTSVKELEDTYFRWLQRTDEQLLAAFDAYDSRSKTKTAEDAL